MDNEINNQVGLTPRALATRGFISVIEANDLQFVGVEPSCLYTEDGHRTDQVNGSRVRLMLANRDIKVKVMGKSPEAFGDFGLGDRVTLVQPEAVLYTRQGDRWPRVSFRAVDVVKFVAAEMEE